MNAFYELTVKSPKEIEIMRLGGEKLRSIKTSLKEKIKEGVRASEIEKLADDLIKKAKGQPSFKMVPNYHWSTCVNVNAGVVHGIPKESLVFQKGDLVSVDVGLYYRGFHTDTSFSKGICPDKKTAHFLETGKLALKRAVSKVVNCGRIFDLSREIETTIVQAGYFPVKALVGHGVGVFLHEEPQIPCFTQGLREESVEIKEGMVLAIEVMYTDRETELGVEKDGWTISARNAKISALFEETVAVTPDGPLVLT